MAYPSPYSLPLGQEGAFRGSLGRPRWPKMGAKRAPEGSKMVSEMAQDSPTRLKIAPNMPPRGSKTAPRRLQVATEPPKEAPKMHKSTEHLKTAYDA